MLLFFDFLTAIMVMAGVSVGVTNNNTRNTSDSDEQLDDPSDDKTIMVVSTTSETLTEQKESAELYSTITEHMYKNFRYYWTMSQKMDPELSGYVKEDGSCVLISLGDEDSSLSRNYEDLPVHFHTHQLRNHLDNADSAKEYHSYQDLVNPPSGQDFYHTLHAARFGKISYVVTHHGVWTIKRVLSVDDEVDVQALIYYWNTVMNAFSTGYYKKLSKDAVVHEQYVSVISAYIKDVENINLNLFQIKDEMFVTKNNWELERMHTSISLKTMMECINKYAGKRIADLSFNLWPSNVFDVNSKCIYSGVTMVNWCETLSFECFMSESSVFEKSVHRKKRTYECKRIYDGIKNIRIMNAFEEDKELYDDEALKNEVWWHGFDNRIDSHLTVDVVKDFYVLWQESNSLQKEVGGFVEHMDGNYHRVHHIFTGSVDNVLRLDDPTIGNLFHTHVAEDYSDYALCYMPPSGRDFTAIINRDLQAYKMNIVTKYGVWVARYLPEFFGLDSFNRMVLLCYLDLISILFHKFHFSSDDSVGRFEKEQCAVREYIKYSQTVSVEIFQSHFEDNKDLIARSFPIGEHSIEECIAILKKFEQKRILELRYFYWCLPK